MEDHITSCGYQNERLGSFEPVDTCIQQQNEDLSSEDDSSEGNDVTKEEESEVDKYEGEMNERQMNVFNENSCDGVQYREEMPNAVEFLSIECDTILEPDSNSESGDHMDFKCRRGKRQKGRIHAFVAPQGSNPVLPIFYQLPLIAELFRFRDVDVYRRTCKDGPFVKIFHPESFVPNGLKESKIDVKDDVDVTSHRGRVNEEESKGNCEHNVPERPQGKSRNMKNHMKDQINKCHICKKQFIDKNLYMMHMSTHVSAVGKSYPCTVCEARFSNRASLKSHTQRHFSLKNVQCQFCDERFQTSSQYIIHKRIHTVEKPQPTGKSLLECDECEATFMQKQALFVHKRKHTGEKPFKCDKCSAAFRARSYLWAHKKCHLERKL